ncbi:MAG: SWIM zinc finger family protein [Bacteroidota bacterium]
MQVTQTYARPSTSHTDAKGTHFQLAAEQHRAPVSLHAMVNHSLAYAKLMLTLRKVVTGDWRSPQKDHSQYQAWVQQQYLKELPQYFGALNAERLELVGKQQALQTQITELRQQIKPIQQQVNQSRRQYFDYLYKHAKDKWYVLDPVISVHPDTVIFEAFSIDESSYARVSVPTENLEIFGDVNYGTTNIDFSQKLADEIYRVRNYRPAWLNVAYEKVELSTSAGASVEKKIDLPETWVRGFLQVQSAASMNGTTLKLSANTLSEIIAVLKKQRAKTSPRSLRFQLKKGKSPRVIIDPWGIEIKEYQELYKGDFEGEIKIWGRRRLLVLDDVLPSCGQVDIKLLGTGMPSYWSVALEGHRFDLGLSGWTSNDWSQQANFDLLASTSQLSQTRRTQLSPLALESLRAHLRLSPNKLARILKIKSTEATAVLQGLCKEGMAMYDHLTGDYRWRQLLQEDMKPATKTDERFRYAIQLLETGKVKIEASTTTDEQRIVHASVMGKNTFKVKLTTDGDGRVREAHCSCGFFRQNKLRKGPCQHLLAVVLEAK